MSPLNKCNGFLERLAMHLKPNVLHREHLGSVVFVCIYGTSENSFIEPSWVVAWDVVVGYDSSVVTRNNLFEVLPSNECLA